MSVEGIQNPPYVFFRDSKIQQKDLNDYTFWEKGSHNMPKGESKIRTAGEGAYDWDSTDYNMILVEETRKFLNRHTKKQPDKPFFSYVALVSDVSKILLTIQLPTNSSSNFLHTDVIK